MAKSEKTEQPTPKRKREARRKGQIAKSQDLTGWAVLLIALYLLPLTIGRIAQVPVHGFSALRNAAHEPDAATAVELLGESLWIGLTALLPLMGVAALASVLATLGQTGLVLTGKPLVPDFKRISPKKGFQRLFSVRSAWETVKQVLKISIVLALAWPRLVHLVEELAGRGRLPFVEGIRIAGAESLGLVRTITWTLFVLSFADYGYQRYQHRRDLRMTKQEVKDEYRNTEGDAMVKGRIRMLQRSVARNRMLAAIGDADVIVTNPTHLAVALRYDPTVGRAPIVVATGADAMAARIRELAHAADVPVVEAKPLARALWRACDPGDEIPLSSYESVAHVLAFVRRLDRRYALGRRLELPAHIDLAEEQLDLIPRKRRRR
jgi:flagellar biosynthesis protein FlhB